MGSMYRSAHFRAIKPADRDRGRRDALRMTRRRRDDNATGRTRVYSRSPDAPAAAARCA